VSQLPIEHLHYELTHLVLGEYLGSGVNRDTYRCRLNPAWVVKVSDRAHTWQNINEWEVWWYASKALAKWLAPCRFISPSGRYLIQDYVEPVRKEELPKTLPRFMIDQKQENYGMLNGHLVARDYGTMVSLVNLIKGRRKALWNPEGGYDGSTIQS
jgi:hypothetical protein